METVYFRMWVTPETGAIFGVFLAVLAVMLAFYAFKMIKQWVFPG